VVALPDLRFCVCRCGGLHHRNLLRSHRGDREPMTAGTSATLERAIAWLAIPISGFLTGGERCRIPWQQDQRSDKQPGTKLAMLSWPGTKASPSRSCRSGGKATASADHNTPPGATVELCGKVGDDGV